MMRLLARQRAKSYALWAEGYVATIDRGDATYLGTYEADTFDDAVRMWIIDTKGTYGKVEKQADGTWTRWGCRIFDNEHDARRAYG